jgi:hypothetical protein
MTWNSDLFCEYQALTKGSPRREVRLGNEQCLTVSGIGSINLSWLAGTTGSFPQNSDLDVILNNVLHVKSLSTTLLSSCELDKDGIDLDNVLGQGVCLRKGTAGPILAKILKKNSVYRLKNESALISTSSQTGTSAYELWH